MFVIYNDETTLLYKSKTREWWETERSAKAARTRAKLAANEWRIADKNEFHAAIELKVRRKNLISGGWFTIAVNTPGYCDPSTESYWSM